MTLEELNERYIYSSDKTEYGRVEYWTIMEPNANGIYKGDCEDYALTVKHKVDGFKDWELWFCKINGEGHCILTKDMAIIDCNCKKPLNWLTYISTYKATNLKKFHWFVIASKKFNAWLIKLIHKVAF